MSYTYENVQLQKDNAKLPDIIRLIPPLVALGYIGLLTTVYTVFHKRVPFLFFFIIHSNDDQFTQDF